MGKGLILAGEPMGLLIARSAGPLDRVSGFDLAVCGAEFNVAIGVARLGHRVTYMTKLGYDPFGKRIVRALGENGIGSEFVTYSSERRTGFMLKGRAEAGDPDIFYFRAGSAASALDAADIEKIDFSAYSHLHLTGILPALSPCCRAAVNAMLVKARKAGLFITFDPNLRPQLWPGEKEMREAINELAFRADMVMPGIEEGRILTGSADAAAIGEFYLAKGVKTVLIKCGAEGAYVMTAEERYLCPGFKVKVVDTVGAGDGFAAGVITGLMEGLPLAEAVTRGNAVGARQVTVRGDNEGLPNKTELKEFIAETPRGGAGNA